MGLSFTYISRITCLVFLSGLGTNTILSNLPGLINAMSIMSTLLVAARTTTPSNSCMPSSSVRSWDTILSVLVFIPIPPSIPAPPPLVGAIESISSKNITHGAACLAFLNISLIPFSDSPTHLDINSGPFTPIKLASDSVATAFASMVLPVPEGPWSRMPFGMACPNFLYMSG